MAIKPLAVTIYQIIQICLMVATIIGRGSKCKLSPYGLLKILYITTNHKVVFRYVQLNIISAQEETSKAKYV